jgi:fatty acid/phospholipid biosynthesis enzyme
MPALQARISHPALTNAVPEAHGEALLLDCGKDIDRHPC